MENEKQTYINLVESLNLPSRLDEIYIKEIQRTIYIKRDDLIHPIISGNKWRKIKSHLKTFIESGCTRILSMGGVHSNHLHALAFVCYELKIPCDLLVYGWYNEQRTPTLMDALNWSAKLYPLKRDEANTIRQNSTEYLNNNFEKSFWIPEGGGGSIGICGLEEMINEMPVEFDQANHLVVCACGTGTSLEGILKYTKKVSLASLRKVVSADYNALNDPRLVWLKQEMTNSFGKVSPELFKFMQSFNSNYNIELDLIYTAPLMQALLTSDITSPFNRIYLIHSGGLQGNRIHL